MIDRKVLLNNYWETKSRIVDDYVENYHLCYKEVTHEYDIEVAIKNRCNDEAFIKVSIEINGDVQTFMEYDMVNAITCITQCIGINA